MDRARELEVFVAVAEASGFARAGARLRMSPPAVTRTVASLEERLGVRLFTRSTRRVVLTEAGGRFLARARQLLADLDDAEREAQGEAARPRGRLTLTAPLTFGRALIAPIVGEFLRAYPEISVSLLLLDRVAQLAEEGIDAALRIGQLPDSGLVARRVGTVRRVLVASPGYLADRGVPASPEALAGHDLIDFTGLSHNREWRFVVDKQPMSLRVAARLELNDAAAALAAAERGEGVTLALSYMVEEALREGRLLTLCEGAMPPPLPVQLVHVEGRLVAPKVRAWMDFAAPRLIERLGARAPVGPAQVPV